MKLQIPDALKTEVPQTIWGKILTATPVIMTVVATLLAALASSEMTRAQYDRSMAAQLQSKAGDQWSYFQAKRLRSSLQRNTLDVLQSAAPLGTFDRATLKQAAVSLPEQLRLADGTAQDAIAQLTGKTAAAAKTATLEQYLKNAPQRLADAEKIKSDILAAIDSPDAAALLAALERAEVPALAPEPELDPQLKTALAALESSKPDAEVLPLVAPIKAQVFKNTLAAAKDRAVALDTATKPVNQGIDNLEKAITRQTALLQDAIRICVLCGPTATLAPSLQREFTAARLRYAAARYDAEARLNQSIGNIYELQVRSNNISAERHHARSQKFFFGMLASQAAVIVATFAIAARRRNLLWSLAAAAGLAAVSFSVYVYVCF